MKGIFWLWATFLIVVLITDSASYWVTRSRLSQSLELALDAAIVGSVEEGDLIWGRNLARSEKANALAHEFLKSNMAGSLSESLKLQFEFQQEGDRVWVSGAASVRVPYLLGSFVGSGSREITVNKKLNYQGQYK